MSEAFHTLPLNRIEADPDQPRKIFEPEALRELAASIRQNGLLQPITVRELRPGWYRLVAGERRWRAHQMIDAGTILARVITPTSAADVLVKQIIENDQRQDVTPLEQARSYQDLMDRTGWSVDELARAIGKIAWRITERTALLRIKPEYQALLAGGSLRPSEAFEMSRLSSRGQDALFRAIKTGQCRTFNDLRNASTAIFEAEGQASLLMDAPPPPTDEEKRDINSFETDVRRIAEMLRRGIADNRVTAIRKVRPDRARQLADLMTAMQIDMRRIEAALRASVVQADLLAQAGD